MIYWISFITSLFFICCAQKTKFKSDLYIILSLIGLLIPCILAGFRSVTIGTDVLSYAKPLFDLAMRADNFSEFYLSHWYDSWRSIETNSFEIGYVLFVWICAKIFKQFWILLFLTQVFIILPIYLAIIKIRNYVSIPIFFVLYYALYFNTSLNLMRQYIACSFIFFVITYYNPENRIIKQIYLILILLLAISFHFSAIIGFILLIVKFYLHNKPFNNTVILCVLFGFTIFFLPFFLNFLRKIGLSYYVNSYLGNGVVHIEISQFLIRLPIIACIVYIIIKKEFSKFTNFYVCISIFSLLCSQLISLGAFNSRIGLYFDIISLILPAFICNKNKNKIVSYTYSFFILLYCIIYWYYFYVELNYSETVPYLF